MEVEYEIAANDAKDISSVAKVSSNAVPGMSYTLPSSSGAGTVDANGCCVDDFYYHSADAWTIEVTLSYTLNGEAKTLTVSDTLMPELKDFLMMNASLSQGSGAIDSKEVSSSIRFLYPSDDRHEYEISFSRVDIGWMKKVPQGGGVFTYEEVGGTRMVWDGTGTSPVTGPTGPAADGENMVLTYSYNSVIDTTPSSSALAEGVTSYFLIFYPNGVGTDSFDSAEYKVYEPHRCQSSPVDYPAGTLSPGATIKHVWFWPSLYHLEVEYEIMANDATDINTEVSVESVDRPWMKTFPPSSAGSGLFDANCCSVEQLWYESGDQWTTELSLSYKLNGETKSMTVTSTAPPELKPMVVMSAAATEGSGPATARDVSASIQIRYPIDGRHDYTEECSGIEIGWMKRVSDGAGGYTYEKLTETRTIWDGFGTSPVSGPTGPAVDGSDSVVEYSWSGNIDISPAASAQVQGATDYYLLFWIGADGADNYDGAHYDVSEPCQALSQPIPLPAADPGSVDPTVTLSHLWYWGEFNASYGLCHLEAEYEITANDATDITSSVTILSDIDGSRFVSKSGIPGAGTIDANWNCGGTLFFNSVEMWIPQIELSYTLKGETKTATVVLPAQHPDRAWMFRCRYSFDPAGDTSVTFYSEDSDRHQYSVAVNEVWIRWFKDAGGYYDSVGSPSQVWSGSPGQLEGPYGPTLNGSENQINFVFHHSSIDFAALKPDEATHFTFEFSTSISGTDSLDGTVYPHDGGPDNPDFTYYPIPTTP